MMWLERIRAVSLLRMMVLCILVCIAAVGLYGIKASKDTNDTVKQVYQLRTDVLIANMAIRNAALATNREYIELELTKPVETTADANRVLEYLSSSDLPKNEKEMLRDLVDIRKEYKIVQKESIAYARNNQDVQFWERLPAYQSKMDLYIRTIDKLIFSINHREDIEYERLKSLILISLVFGISLTSFALWRVLR